MLVDHSAKYLALLVNLATIHEFVHIKGFVFATCLDNGMLYKLEILLSAWLLLWERRQLVLIEKVVVARVLRPTHNCASKCKWIEFEQPESG